MIGRFYNQHVLPHLVDAALRGREITRMRERAVSGLDGVVLEIGFGSGRNVPLYPPAVSRVLGVEPAEEAWAMASKRIAASPVPVEHIGLDGQSLPLEDASVDHVLSTWTLCTIPDVQAALAETLRVLRPGGSFHFVEHGLSPDDHVARWQHRLTPIQRRLAGGCHLNRPIDRLLVDAGFRLERLDTHYGAWPKAFGWVFEGVGVKPAV